jgi:transmembrane sensor
MSSKSIELRRQQEAGRWYARLASTDCTADERAAFEIWRAADPENSVAFELAERVGATLARLAAIDPRLKAMVDEAAGAGATLPDDAHDEGEAERAPAEGGRAAPRRRRTLRWAAAAAVAATAVAAVVGINQLASTRGELVRVGIEYSAGDERRAVELEDGTRVHLDVASAIEVRFSADRRDVVLTHGRALFDVAHDASRPFTVGAGAGCVTALGTVFQVDRTSSRVTVTLAEGSVSVMSVNAGDTPVLLAPGEQLSLSAGEPNSQKRTVDARAATSWSFGRHVFRETPLADALREVNRYAAVKVRIADSSLAELPVSGSFAAGDSESIVAALSAVLPVQATMAGAEIRLNRNSRQLQ